MSATKAQQQRCQISKFQTDDESTMRCAENFAEVETAHPKDSYQVAPCLMLELVYLEQKVLTATHDKRLVSRGAASRGSMSHSPL